ncbi:hypothetical protein Nepgr_020284 [Nepenthes gracilis]|uniref:DNA-binding protein BIN4 n=1 Tax=Nepenthes gracilis TaxID=150966 RepID=A0AAD3SVS1_NEPGR|nr:hypothetical protein Nepgr_020284 [Nepenthes gracilis]
MNFSSGGKLTVDNFLYSLKAEMSNSKEDSPDWLRAFQAPSRSVLTLSSDSESSPNKSPIKDEGFDLQRNPEHTMSQLINEDHDQDKILDDSSAKSAISKSSNKKSPKGQRKVRDQMSAKRRKLNNHKKGGNNERIQQESFDEQMKTHAGNRSVWMLSSDSESYSDTAVDVLEAKEEPAAHKSSEFQEEYRNDAGFVNSNGDSVPKVTSKGKSPKKRLKQAELVHVEKKNVKTYQDKEKEIIYDSGKGKEEEDGVGICVEGEGKSDNHAERHVTSSSMPLMLPEKVHQSKALVECEGESIDLSGDMGAVGRVIISEDHEMFLDLKGIIYKTAIVPSRSFCVVSVGQSEAKIEAIMNDFIQLKPQSSVYDAETMVEGTLDGFSFDSEDEADKMSKAVTLQNSHNEGAEKQTNKKTKGKFEKKSGFVLKKGKATGGKLLKKRKPQAPKKGKTKK